LDDDCCPSPPLGAPGIDFSKHSEQLPSTDQTRVIQEDNMALRQEDIMALGQEDIMAVQCLLNKRQSQLNTLKGKCKDDQNEDEVQNEDEDEDEDEVQNKDEVQNEDEDEDEDEVQNKDEVQNEDEDEVQNEGKGKDKGKGKGTEDQLPAIYGSLPHLNFRGYPHNRGTMARDAPAIDPADRAKERRTCASLAHRHGNHRQCDGTVRAKQRRPSKPVSDKKTPGLAAGASPRDTPRLGDLPPDAPGGRQKKIQRLDQCSSFFLGLTCQEIMIGDAIARSMKIL
jgi:hypothetical protein